MVIPKVAICPICGKKTYLRIEDGGYLNEYPIRVHCANCRALIKGVYIMGSSFDENGLHMYNAKTEECDVDTVSNKILNADYVVDISGELPCKKCGSLTVILLPVLRFWKRQIKLICWNASNV